MIILLSKVNNRALTGSWLGALLLSGATVATGREPFTAADLWDWRGARDAQISSDGRRVVYAEEWNDRGKDAVCSNLWLTTSDGKQRQRLTEGPWRDDWPRWSPDGESIAYRSNRAGGAGIRVRRLDSGADSLIAGGNPDSLAWSPDGRWIAFTAWVPRNMAPDWAPAATLRRLVSDTSGSA
jgi:Tol biopolymer transport system component